MRARRALGVTAAGALLALAAAVEAGAAPSRSPGLSGIWWITAAPFRLLPAGEREAPLRPERRARYEQAREAVLAGTVQDDVSKYCLPEGAPRAAIAPFPFEVVESPGRVTFLYESHNALRTVLLSKPAPEDASADPSFMGLSTGVWRGGTLVIRTTRTKEITGLDPSGLPHSDALVVTESYTPSADGRRLRLTIEIDDPNVFTRRWKATFNFDRRDDLRIREYFCGGDRRNVSARMEWN